MGKLALAPAVREIVTRVAPPFRRYSDRLASRKISVWEFFPVADDLLSVEVLKDHQIPRDPCLPPTTGSAELEDGKESLFVNKSFSAPPNCQKKSVRSESIVIK